MKHENVRSTKPGFYVLFTNVSPETKLFLDTVDLFHKCMITPQFRDVIINHSVFQGPTGLPGDLGPPGDPGVSVSVTPSPILAYFLILSPFPHPQRPGP